MNKYQKQAALDMIKVATIILGAIAVIGYIIKLGVEANDLIAAGSFAIMAWCIYQLFQVRVSQLESEDKRAELEQKYK
jgi:Zn-dependent protease with chaperone function